LTTKFCTNRTPINDTNVSNNQKISLRLFETVTPSHRKPFPANMSKSATDLTINDAQPRHLVPPHSRSPVARATSKAACLLSAANAPTSSNSTQNAIVAGNSPAAPLRAASSLSAGRRKTPALPPGCAEPGAPSDPTSEPPSPAVVSPAPPGPPLVETPGGDHGGGEDLVPWLPDEAPTSQRAYSAADFGGETQVPPILQSALIT
jgi:hypothetical protein